ncbi:MAG: hypothetical protein AXA67_08830 [Methylothermaceae bacteria B42]|nr:MAG: hypothetical protein AXA67_08830 [Methylothermaceae bacteria B42]HHJ39409.1 type II toxin-antitoxin system prevent-host-death family antitoxin [Methylothermaceae bacterium]
MRTINIKEAREQFKALVDAVIAGEDIIICRRNKPVAKLIRLTEKPVFPDRSEFRSRIKQAKTPSSVVVRALREERE